MREHFTFNVDGAQCHATLDDGAKRVGLLIVTGGNEIRSGAFAGQAHIAARIAAKGYPVLRFDRRGVGDSEGENAEFHSASPDIAAALAAFKARKPELRAVAGFGICDGAAALMLAEGAGCSALVLANPWTFDDDHANAMPAEAIRERYAAKLKDPSEWKRLLIGGVNLRKLAGGLKAARNTAPPAPSNLLESLKAGIASFAGEIRFLVAKRDRTGAAFLSAWGEDDRIAVSAKADHAFSDPADQDWLVQQLLSTLDEQARQLDMG